MRDPLGEYTRVLCNEFIPTRVIAISKRSLLGDITRRLDRPFLNATFISGFSLKQFVGLSRRSLRSHQTLRVERTNGRVASPMIHAHFFIKHPAHLSATIVNMIRIKYSPVGIHFPSIAPRNPKSSGESFCSAVRCRPQPDPRFIVVRS